MNHFKVFCRSRVDELERVISETRTAQARAELSSLQARQTAEVVRDQMEHLQQSVSHDDRVDADVLASSSRSAGRSTAAAFAAIHAENEALRSEVRSLRPVDPTSFTARASALAMTSPAMPAPIQASTNPRYKDIADRTTELQEVIQQQAATIASLQTERQRIKSYARRYEAELVRREHTELNTSGQSRSTVGSTPSHP
jgi:hypothetical protein